MGEPGVSPSGSDADFRLHRDVATSSIASPTAANPSQVSEALAEDMEFSPEELRLEAEVEQSLRELEAADAAMAALRFQLANATDEAEATRGELAQLRSVAESWN